MIPAATAPPSFLTGSITDRQQAVDGLTLENNGFFPPIALRDFMERLQVADDYSVERRLQCLQEAMLQINHELSKAVCDWMEQGYLELDAVPQGLLGDCPELRHHYFTAVYCFALMLLLERFRSTDTTTDAEGKATMAEQRAYHWRGEYLRHINALLGNESRELEALAL